MSRVTGVLLIIVLLITACGPLATSDPQGTEVTVAGGTYTEIGVDQLLPLLEDDRYTLVNVHVPFEGNIPGTDVSIPFDAVEQNLSQLPDKRHPIIVYCKGEGMATAAAETLVQLGYSNIYMLDGGMTGWQEAGQALDVQS